MLKRNEQGQKLGDSLGESKGKRSFPSEASDFRPRKNFTKGLSSSEEDSSKARSLFEISNDSPPVTSSESERVTEMQPVVVGIDQFGLWGSQYLCDVPKVSCISMTKEYKSPILTIFQI